MTNPFPMPNKLSQFWQEFRRRKVLPFLIGYIAACFAIIEFLTNTSERYSIPDTTVDLIYILAAIGLPIVIVLPWFINRKKSEAITDDLGAIQPNARLDKSIIVLPFENISPDPDQEYFSDGLTEEIITDLSHIHDLLVISRSSTMTFKGTKKKIKEIAGDVNVRYVLEGSVRKAGNNLRITAQLIDANNDAHIWAEKYNGTLENVFEIQEKVSKSIAESLRINLDHDTVEHISRPTIKDPIVYELYLKARYENWQFNETSFRNAEELLNKGLKYAGDNELLYAELCHTNVQYVNNLMKDPFTYKDLLNKAKQYAQKAIEMSPSSALSLYSQGMALYQSCNPIEAMQSWKKAITIEPNSSESMIYLLLGFMYSATGLDQDEAMRLFKRAKSIDPLTAIVKTCDGWGLIWQGKFEETINEWAEWQEALESINSPFVIACAWIYGLNQEFNEAIRIIDKFVASAPTHIMSSLGQFMKYSWTKEKQKALSVVNEPLEEAVWWDDAWSMVMAEGYAILEEKEKAFHFLNRSIDYGITNVAFLSKYDPFLENLKSDIRFKKSMEKANSFVKSLEHELLESN